MPYHKHNIKFFYSEKEVHLKRKRTKRVQGFHCRQQIPLLFNTVAHVVWNRNITEPQREIIISKEHSVHVQMKDRNKSSDYKCVCNDYAPESTELLLSSRLHATRLNVGRGPACEGSRSSKRDRMCKSQFMIREGEMTL